MRAYIVSLVILSAGAVAESPNLGLGAEVTVSDALLKQFQFTQWQTRPFVDDGHMMHPNVSVTITPSFQNSVQGSAVARLNVNLAGTSSTSETQRRGLRGRKRVDVNVTNQLNGHYEQDIFVDSRGLSPAGTRGHTNAQASISTSNNFRLLNGLVNNIAFKKADSMVSSKLPIKMAELDGKVTGGLSSAADQAGHTVAQILADAGQVLVSDASKNMQLRFKSAGGGSGGLTSQVLDPDARDRKPRPKFDFANQAMTTSVVHQDLVSAMLNQQLAGKEVKFGEFHKLVCAQVSIRALNFCNTELPADTKNTSILFNEPKAVDFTFDKGKIVFRMHAAYRKLKADRVISQAGISEPSDKDVSLETEPYVVEVAYKMGPDGATQESLQVLDEERPETKKKDGGAEEKKGGWHLDSIGSAFNALKGATIGSATKKELTKQFAQLFKPKIDFGPVSFPTKITSGDNQAPQMTEAGSLVPLETKLQDGWLAVSMGYCGEGFRSLGLTPSLIYPQGGGAPSIYVKAVMANSPAWQGAVRPGDRIDTYGAPGERGVTLHRNSNDFIEFTRKRASTNNAADRTIQISGTTAAGQRFTRTISMCPAGYDHRAHAQAAFAKMKAK